MNPLIEKRAAFGRLHESGCFVMPNPWDAGTAIFLQHAGFEALATTSAGVAFSMGRPDEVGSLSLETVLAHLETLVGATDLPVNADFQAGYADTAAGVGANVRRCVATGVAGLSIEDATGDPIEPLYPLARAVERIRAARAAIDATGASVVLTARAECFLVGRPDLDEVTRRLRAYAEAGADCLYAPGLKTPDAIRTVVEAVAPKPVNVLVAGQSAPTVADLRELGVRRVSVGSALARVAWGAMMGAARQIATEGRFDRLAEGASFAELNALFGSRSL